MSSESLKPEVPRTKVHVMEQQDYDVYGVDAIWTNQYAGPKSDFFVFRRQYTENIDELIQLVARHVAEGRYFIISLNASKRFLHVACGCEIMMDELFKGFDNPQAE